MNWIQYANQGAVRNQPLSEDLLTALSYLPDMGIEMKVYSGGQAPKGAGGPRTGSTRHDHGNAADADFYYKGRKLDWNNPSDIPILQDMVRQGKQRGLTGWGAGNDYMGAGRMHVGFGTPGVWGAGGKGANAPDWLREAYHGEPGHNHRPGDENQAIADSAMAAIGKAPVRQPTISTSGGVTTAIGGSGADTMADTGGLLGRFARTEDQVGGLLGMLFKNITPDRADSIRAGLASMQGINNQGAYNAATGRMQARRDAKENDLNFARKQELDTQERAREEAQRQQAAEYLGGLPNGNIFAGALMAGADPGSTMNAYLRTATASNDPNVQSSQMMPDQSGTILTMRDGSVKVLTVGGEELTGQAAQDYVRSAQENYTADQRSIYDARRSGTLDADIDQGGTAAQVKKVGEATADAGVSAWDDYGKMQTSIGNINEAITAIDNGAQSGAIAKYFPNVTEASASLNNAMNRMGLDVVGAVTFGALSEGELQLAMSTAVPQDLSPPELRSWLEKKKVAQEKSAAMLADAAQYLTTPGNNLNGWIQKNTAAQQTAPASAPSQTPAPAATPVQPVAPSTPITAAAVPTLSEQELTNYLQNTPGDQIPADVWAAIEARVGQ